MMLITREYLALQRDLHTRFNYGYGADSVECAQLIRDMRDVSSVLDYGCGRGSLGRLINQDFDVREYDPCIEGKDGLPKPADVVVCADVLEHIEPDCLESVLKHLKHLVLNKLILVIATKPSSKIMSNGQQAHLLVKPSFWWTEKIARHFEILFREDRSEQGRGILMICKREKQT
jgi:hypothetical protein